MNRKTLAVAAALVLALPIGAVAQEGTPRAGHAPVSEGRRAEMRQRIHERFLDVAVERLELDATQRTRLARVLEQNRAQRREIMEQGMQLRHEAADLLDADAPAADRAERILAELTRLRERELQVWRSEQDALAGVLTPVQRLELMALQARFDDRVRHMRRERAPEAPRGNP